MDATTLDWLEMIGRIGGAAGLGGLIGIEREVDGQDAGFRTHLLLAVGAALFGAISVGAFGDFVTERASTNVNVDVTRIASYVAAGIGFIGGGAIIKSGGSVRGLTTSASLWSAAAVGLAAGVGFWAGAVTATVTSLVALAVLKPVSAMFRRRFCSNDNVTITLTESSEIPRIVEEVRAAAGALIRQIVIGEDDSGTNQIEVHFFSALDAGMLQSLLERIGARDDVTAMRVGA
jgi:putative Mg2+ transporter-C (MgtC) family protein